MIIRARLPRGASRLARLFIFAREGGGEFAPYVPNLRAMVDGGEPSLLNPISLRLTEVQPVRETRFDADFDGWVCVMQEIDTKDEALARIRLRRRIASYIGWKEWLIRLVTGSLQWPLKTFST